MVTVYTSTSQLPTMSCCDFFHSSELMQIYEQTMRHRPYMAVATNEQGSVIAHLLAVVRNGKCRIFGEGEYVEMDAHEKERVFGDMLSAVTSKLSGKVFYIEVSDLSTKMFAYKHFRNNKYFPIHWLQVYNSLHSKAPDERVSRQLLSKINQAKEMGVETKLVENESDFKSFYKLVRTYYNFHLRKFCPVKAFFKALNDSDNAQLFITTSHGKTIGAAAIVRTQGNSYLWFGAYLEKVYPKLLPDFMTIWNVMNREYRLSIRHFHFMDVGLPFFKNTYYDKIIQFGGRTVGAYRWFRFYPGILNRIISIFFK
ncbi:MAG: GNAT family N-acetyltransferase [Prevotellaceae bacterium]|nr:GNAT family N-acetyltransferase [Prevotellaceae bacterium]